MITTVSPTIYVYKTTLLHVKDGDTVQAELDLGFKMRWTADIRFSDIDTYERTGAAAHPLGTKAKEFLEGLFEKFGKEFYLHSMKDSVAIYNRVAGKLYLETLSVEKYKKDRKRAFIDVNATMKANGFDKSGTVPYVEGRAPIYKMIVAADIDAVIKPPKK